VCFGLSRTVTLTVRPACCLAVWSVSTTWWIPARATAGWCVT